MTDLELEDLTRLEAIAEMEEAKDPIGEMAHDTGAIRWGGQDYKLQVTRFTTQGTQQGLTFKASGMIIPWLNEVRVEEPAK